MSRKSSLLDCVTVGVRKAKPWVQRMPPDAMAELAVVREKYRKGELGTKKHLIARLILESEQARSWPLPSEREVVRWLAEND